MKKVLLLLSLLRDDVATFYHSHSATLSSFYKVLERAMKLSFGYKKPWFLELALNKLSENNISGIFLLHDLIFY